MQKLRIMYFQQNLAVGSCEEYFYLLMEGIDKIRFDVTFVCPQGTVFDSLANRLEALNVKVYRYSLKDSNLRIILRLYLLFRQLRPTIAHFNDPCLLGIIAARLAGIPALLMTHHTPELNRKYNWKARLLEKIIFSCCGLFTIFTSEYDRETGIRKDNIPEDKSFVIYYGLPLQKFNQRYNKKEIYDEFSLSEGCRIIGNVARLSPQKGQSYLIEAAPAVIEHFKSARFFFIGTGELETELKTRVREKGLEDYFIFTGHRVDIPRLLSAFEVLVMPSLFEGLCFAVIEAQAMGVPVIATSVGGLRRSVVDGKTGMLIPAGDAHALAQSILWMLGHPKEAKEMGLAGQRHFTERFTQQRMVKITQEAYENILAKVYPS